MSVRECTPSFFKMWETWVATVRRESSSLAAISGLDMPSSTSLATVVSVGVRLSQPLHLPTPPCHDDACRGVPRRSVEPLRGPHSYLEWHEPSGEPTWTTVWTAQSGHSKITNQIQ